MTKTVSSVQSTIPNRLLHRQAAQRGRLRSARSASEHIRRAHFTDLHPSIFSRSRPIERDRHKLRPGSPSSLPPSRPNRLRHPRRTTAPAAALSTRSPSPSLSIPSSSGCITINSDDECLCSDASTPSAFAPLPGNTPGFYQQMPSHPEVIEPSFSPVRNKTLLQSDQLINRLRQLQQNNASQPSRDNNTGRQSNRSSASPSKPSSSAGVPSSASNRASSDTDKVPAESPNSLRKQTPNRNKTPRPPSSSSALFAGSSLESSDSETYQAQQDELRRLKVLLRSPEVSSAEVSVKDPLELEDQSLVLFQRDPSPSDQSPPPLDTPGLFSSIFKFTPTSQPRSPSSRTDTPEDEFSLAFSSSPLEQLSWPDITMARNNRNSNVKVKDASSNKRKSQTASPTTSPRNSPPKTKPRLKYTAHTSQLDSYRSNLDGAPSSTVTNQQSAPFLSTLDTNSSSIISIKSALGPLKAAPVKAAPVKSSPDQSDSSPQPSPGSVSTSLAGSPRHDSPTSVSVPAPSSHRHAAHAPEVKKLVHESLPKLASPKATPSPSMRSLDKSLHPKPFPSVSSIKQEHVNDDSLSSLIASSHSPFPLKRKESTTRSDHQSPKHSRVVSLDVPLVEESPLVKPNESLSTSPSHPSPSRSSTPSSAPIASPLPSLASSSSAYSASAQTASSSPAAPTPSNPEAIVDAVHSVVQHLLRVRSFMCENSPQTEAAAYLKLECNQKNVRFPTAADLGHTFQVTTWVNETLDSESNQ
jgi:hypothetical protein